MKRYGTLALLALIGITLDTTLFAALPIAPRLLLAAALAACAALDVQSAILTAFLGGLMVDALANSYLGLCAACGLLSVSALWLLIRKNHPKKFVLFLYAGFAAAIALPAEWLYAYLAGAHYNGLSVLLTRALPSAVLTGAATVAFVWLLGVVLKGRRDRI